jgi:hypothetical protein
MYLPHQICMCRVLTSVLLNISLELGSPLFFQIMCEDDAFNASVVAKAFALGTLYEDSAYASLVNAHPLSAGCSNEFF